jgi:hypothetical protein
MVLAKPASTVDVKFLTEELLMKRADLADEPSVNTSGGGPASRKRADSGDNSASPFSSKKGKPVTAVCRGQSGWGFL